MRFPTCGQTTPPFADPCLIPEPLPKFGFAQLPAHPRNGGLASRFRRFLGPLVKVFALRLPAAPPNLDLTWVCCGREFENEKAYLSRCDRKHMHRNPVRNKICSFVCPACHVNFFSRTRVYRHIAVRSQSCRDTVTSFDDLADQVVEEFWAHKEPAGKLLLRAPEQVYIY